MTTRTQLFTAAVALALALGGCSHRTEQRAGAAVQSAERDLRTDTRRAGASLDHAAHDVAHDVGEATHAETSSKDRAVAASQAERAAREAAAEREQHHVPSQP